MFTPNAAHQDITTEVRKNFHVEEEARLDEQYILDESNSILPQPRNIRNSKSCSILQIDGTSVTGQIYTIYNLGQPSQKSSLKAKSPTV